MKVSELIDILKKKNPNTRIVVQGYEDGFCDVSGIKEIGLKLNVNSESFYGPHEEVERGEDEKALFITRIENLDRE